MPSGTKKCKICGCEYPYCKTITQNKFRYQDVACCPEHAAEYFKKIELSRMTVTPDTTHDADYIEDEDDMFFDEETFEDDEEEIEIETI